MQRRLWYHSLLAMVLVFGLGISTVYAAPSQFTQDYYGENGSSYVNVIGTTHSTPELTLSGGTLGIDWAQLREGDATGYGVFFEYIESDPATEANITLTAGAKISLISDGDFGYLDLMGIYTDDFAESHVTLLDNSSIFVSAQGDNVYSGGVALDNIYAVGTAAVTLDGGSTITANATAISDLNGSDAMARGVSLSDDVHAKVTLDNGSAIIAEASAQYTGSEADPGNTEATAYGIDADSSTQVEVTLSGASKVSSKATAVVDDEEIDGYTGATATGIYAYGDTITVDLAEASVVAAQATAADVQSYGIQIEAVDHGEVNLDGASRVSSVATSTGNDGFAQGIGVSIEAQYPDTAILSLHHDSSIDTAASGAVALTIGGLIQSSPHGVATIDGGSTITATSTAASNSTTGEAFSVAGATAFATYNVAEVELTLNDAQLISTMTATATDTATDDIGGYQADALIAGEATPGGILISDYTTADVNLTDATISVAAEATASSITGDSRAMSFDDDSDNPTWASGLQVMGRTSGGNATINLLRSDINVNVKTTAGDVASTLASGITMYNDSGQDHVSLSLQDSNISVVTTAAATAEGGAVIVEALGIYTESVDGDISFDNTILNVKALSPTVGAQGIAAGVVIENSSASTLALQNHSQIVATQSAGLTAAEGLNGSVGVYAANTAITVDSTSSISADWAVYSAGGVSVENSGLLAGRLQVTDLNNASSGVFQATFGREDGFAYPEAGEDYYFNVTSGATLDNGTTFRIVPTDNLGFTAFGDTQKYALLNSDSGTWTQTELNLTTQSPLLGLSWAEESDGSKLIVTATLLSPEDSGISGNAQGAYRAAMDDGLFDIASDPEKWVPNVSGAFLSGMIQTLGSSHVNIGNRLGVLMGMNSGDEVAASNGMWFSIRYTEADQSRRDGIDGFDADTTGYSLGFDREIGNAVIGIAYTHGNTDADADDNSATFDMTDDLLSLYGSYDGGNWYSEAIFSIGFGDVDSVRYDTDQLLHGDYDSDSYNAKVDVGMKLNAGGVQVNPLFAMEYSTKDYDSYTEAGGSRALHIESQDYELFKVGAGVNASQEFQRNWGIITPEVSAMLNYDVTNDRVVTTANFVGGSTSFVAKGIEPADTSWDLGAAVTITGLGNKNVSFRLGYDYSGRADFNAHSFIGKLRFEF